MASHAPAPHPLIDAIRAERERRDMSQDAAAQLAGIARHSWARFERGEQSPTLGTLVAMADAVGLAVTIRRKPARWS